MEKIYLITGTTGFLGREVAKQLTAQQKKVIGLRLPGDKAHLLPKVEYIIGDKEPLLKHGMDKIYKWF